MNIIKTLKPLVNRHIMVDTRVLAVFLLGSFAEGNERAGSDVDLGVMPYQGCVLDAQELFNWSSALAYELGRSVDIGVLDGSSLVYSREALFKGLVVSSRNDLELDVRALEITALFYQYELDSREVRNGYRSR